MELLISIAKSDADMAEADGRQDATGGVSRLRLINELSDDIYSAVVRSERIAGTMTKFLGCEVYH